MTDQKTQDASGASLLSVKLERLNKKGLITHINGQRLLKPVLFEAGELVVMSSVSGTEIVIPQVTWVEF